MTHLIILKNLKSLSYKIQYYKFLSINLKAKFSKSLQNILNFGIKNDSRFQFK